LVSVALSTVSVACWAPVTVILPLSRVSFWNVQLRT